MKLPKELSDKSEWVLVGPMGPMLPAALAVHPVMAVDGGAHFADNEIVWIGDSDSFHDAPKTSHFFQLPATKDASDFSCALKLFDRQVPYTFHLWGFSGGRKDHELFVWGEVLSFLEQHPECRFICYDREGRVETHFLGQGTWNFEHHGTFSLGSLRKIRVRMTGAVKYPIPLESWLPALSSWGLSNIGSGKIVLENDGPAFLHYPEEK